MADLKSGVLTSFTGGEVAPALAGRIDYEELRSSSRFIENFIPQPQGGLKKFYGTNKISSVDPDSVYKMIPFDGADEPIVLLFINNKVFCVTESGMVDTEIPFVTVNIVDVSYVQINDVIKFTSETYGMFEIHYMGREEGVHKFNFLQSEFKQVPYFPLGWKGLYWFPIVTKPGATGEITIETASSADVAVTRVTVPLPEALWGCGAGKNVASPDALKVIYDGNNDYRPNGTMGQARISFWRRRAGADSRLFVSVVGQASYGQIKPS